MPFITDEVVRVVEQTGSEAAVTLLVQGAIVTGMLTPRTRYDAWVQEVTARAGFQGGRTKLRGLMGPITEEQSDAIREKYERRHPDGPPDDGFDLFALRNATIQAGAAMHGPTFPYLLINAYNVGAYTMGTPDEVG
jgi:hypothetical protein